MAKEEFGQWKYYKSKLEDIEFFTDAGTPIVLKNNKGEYRAYNKKTGEDLHLGAIWTEDLIKYIKAKY